MTFQSFPIFNPAELWYSWLMLFSSLSRIPFKIWAQLGIPCSYQLACLTFCALLLCSEEVNHKYYLDLLGPLTFQGSLPCYPLKQMIQQTRTRSFKFHDYDSNTSWSLMSIISVNQGCCKTIHIQIVLSLFWASASPAENPLYSAHEASVSVTTNTYQKFPGLFIINYTTHSAESRLLKSPMNTKSCNCGVSFCSLQKASSTSLGIAGTCLGTPLVLWLLPIKSWLSHDLSLAKPPCIPATCLHHTLPPYSPHLSFLKLPYSSITTFCNPTDVIAQGLQIGFQFPLLVSDAVGYSIVHICITQPYLGLLHQLAKTNIFSTLELSGLKCHFDSHFLQKTSVSQFST